MASSAEGADGCMRIAAFVGKVKDFRLYLIAMRTWLAWERAGSSRAVIH